LSKEIQLSEEAEVLEIMHELYEELGDELSLQYAGSKAHKRKTTVFSDLFTSAKRYFHNALSDAEKQKRINLFLGLVRPSQDSGLPEEIPPKGPDPSLPTQFKYYISN
jgi:hypothetical protein